VVVRLTLEKRLAWWCRRATRLRQNQALQKRPVKPE